MFSQIAESLGLIPAGKEGRKHTDEAIQVIKVAADHASARKAAIAQLLAEEERFISSARENRAAVAQELDVIEQGAAKAWAKKEGGKIKVRGDVVEVLVKTRVNMIHISFHDDIIRAHRP